MNNFNEKAISDVLEKSYGINALNLDLLTLGADINALVFKVQCSNNKSYFLKMKKDVINTLYFNIFELFEKEKILETIFPIRSLAGKLFERINEQVIILYPFVKGEDGFSKKLNSSQWTKLGKTLKNIHDISIPSFIQNKIEKEKYNSDWSAFVAEKISIINDFEFYDNDNAEFVNSLQCNKNKIIEIMSNAEDLRKNLKNDNNIPFVLCHSDIHAGNVLISENDSIYIIDWDNPILAPKERDLMFIGGGVGNTWNCKKEEKLFYSGYGEVEINTKVLAYYRLERIIIDIGEYMKVVLFDPDQKNKKQMIKEYLDLFSKNGVVDIALDTFTNL